MEDGKTMTTLNSFEYLDAWQAARVRTNEAYRLTRREPLARDFGFCDLRRQTGQRPYAFPGQS